ncbi:MAG: inorganic pyrophosphatase [Candidatus Zhuqueibacterota bacterium]
MVHDLNSLLKLMGEVFKAHPWHGISIGDGQPKVVTAYIELVPEDTVKYELDKESGLLKVDRPQVYSNICPTLYGLIPQTYCGEKIAEFCQQKTGRQHIVGDGDPLDICVFSEKLIPHGDVILQARPVGGLRMIDHGEADDKIIAVMKNDAVFEEWDDITDCPNKVIERLKHYFLTYKQAPGSSLTDCEITDVYNKQEAYEIIRRGYEDYRSKFPEIENVMSTMLRR